MPVLVPYFSFTYGEKFTAMSKLLRIIQLKSLNTLSSRLEIMNLQYSLTSGGKDRTTSLNQKLSLVTEKS